MKTGGSGSPTMLKAQRMLVGSGNSDSPCKIGCIRNKEARVIRIVHISDTLLQHRAHADSIPAGDILVMSGNFNKTTLSKCVMKERDYKSEIEQINAFFARLPHKHKVFVAGNHEANFAREDAERTQKLMTAGIYLQDSSVVLEGVKFYGTPWTATNHHSKARGFAVSPDRLPSHWQRIPLDVDVLVTQCPPFDVLDLGQTSRMFEKEKHCTACHDTHKGFKHFGCPTLRGLITNQIRPKAHLFGHVHDCNGVTGKDGILFSNASMKSCPRPKVIDYYIEPEKCVTLSTPVLVTSQPQQTKCTLQ